MKVVIVGGTHGNEKTGVFLLNKWRMLPECLPAGHEYLLLDGNPKAIAQNRRFTEVDLNRSFNGGNTDVTTYEFQRAAEIKTQVEVWARGEKYFLIDLHTTTSNMGASIVLSKTDLLSAYVLQQVQSFNSEVKVLFNSDCDDKSVFVESIAPHSLLIEVGPVSQNVFDPNLIQLTEKLTLSILQQLLILQKADFANLPASVRLQGFQEYASVPYPEIRNGIPSAIIHPHLQGRDYQKLKNGDPIFLLPNGDSVVHTGKDAWPVFINEAAYYDKNIAMLLAEPAEILFSAPLGG